MTRVAIGLVAQESCSVVGDVLFFNIMVYPQTGVNLLGWKGVLGTFF